MAQIVTVNYVEGSVRGSTTYDNVLDLRTDEAGNLLVEKEGEAVIYAARVWSKAAIQVQAEDSV